MRVEYQLRFRAKDEYRFVLRCYFFDSLRKVRHLGKKIARVDSSHRFRRSIPKQKRPKRHGRQDCQHSNEYRTCARARQKSQKPGGRQSVRSGGSSQRERRKQLLEIMWKEISARTCTD